MTKFVTGKSENQRFLKSFEREIGKALRQWQYFAYIDNSEESPRTDVTLTFRYLLPSKSKHKTSRAEGCTTSFLPQLPSHSGEKNDPLVNINICKPPLFPRRRKFAKKSEKVLLNFDINREGRVTSPKLASSQQESIFAKSALQALRTWRYIPYLVAGIPQARDNLEIPFYFGTLPDSANDHTCTSIPSRRSLRKPKVKIKLTSCERDDALPSQACRRLRGKY
ncbi:MAG: TonB family protein [Kordiimonadaceae bacterium]|nr:TonB family protein [Kordiimonadaceae bacterium]